MKSSVQNFSSPITNLQNLTTMIKSNSVIAPSSLSWVAPTLANPHYSIVSSFKNVVKRSQQKVNKSPTFPPTYPLVPGTTRDRSYGNGIWLGRQFVLVDTGGIVIHSEDHIASHIKEQAFVAIEEAKVVVFMVDAKDGYFWHSHFFLTF